MLTTKPRTGRCIYTNFRTRPTDAVDEADAHCLVRVDSPASEAQIARDAHAHNPLQRRKERRGTEFDLGMPECRIGRGDPEVTQYAKVHTAGHRRTVDSGQ
jgi:hypothetical protein